MLMLVSVVILSSTLVLGGPVSASAGSDHSEEDYGLGTGAAIDATGRQLDLFGKRTHLGSAPDGIAADEAFNDAIGSADEGAAPPIGCTVVLDNEQKERCSPAERVVPGEPAVTLTDLATVRPATPELTGDPVGYGLMNAPANVIANAHDQTIATELFNRPVQVRFVPVSYTFDYGDGATRTSDTGGGTWESQGLAQFTPTATTHTYGARGIYTVAVTVAYAPFVDFGSGWRPVAGTVSATSGGYRIQIVEARTALVEHDCNEDPSGVGCPVR